MNDKHKDQRPEWLKSKGYMHITPSLNLHDYKNWKNLEKIIRNKKFISKYCFFPLLHANIIERKYKKIPLCDSNGNLVYKRNHKEIKDGKIVSTAKKRPIHYASHMDSLIYSYYSVLLQNNYKRILDNNKSLSDSITAYRKIPKDVPNSPDEPKGKSTIDFAYEVFNEIEKRAEKDNDVAVLAFDIKSFFSNLNHKKLKAKWLEVMGFTSFNDNKDHERVFNAVTNFSYILLDDLRIKKTKNGKKSGFNESKLAHIRKTKGYKCFFESNEDFRRQIKNGNIKVHKNSFHHYDKKLKKRIIKGIPQGLPISATLANIYLLDFDRNIIEKLVKNEKCYYRRYSDDIIVIGKKEQIDTIKTTIKTEMSNNLVEISEEKTETFIFKTENNKLKSYKILEKGKEVHLPLIYLGFEFRGYNKMVKSTNLAKFNRKLINVIKRRARRAKKAKEKNPLHPDVIFLNQIKRLYNTSHKKTDSDSQDKSTSRKYYYLEFNEDKGIYKISHNRNVNKKNIKDKKTKKYNSNYISYINRASEGMFEKKIKRQIRKRKKIIYQAIQKHLKSN